MAANCEEIFQRRQELIRQRDQLGDAANGISVRLRKEPDWATNPGGVPDERVRSAMEAAQVRLETDEIQDLISKGLEIGVPVRIGDGQPTNHNQIKRWHDAYTAEDYAQLHQLAAGGHSALDPADYALLTQQYGPDRIQELLMQGYREFLDPSKGFAQLAADVAPFVTLVERMARIRAAYEGTAKGYLALVNDAANLLEAGDQVPGTLRGEIFQAWKYTLVTQRHYDFARRRTGQTLRSLQDNPDIVPRVVDFDGLSSANVPQAALTPAATAPEGSPPAAVTTAPRGNGSAAATTAPNGAQLPPPAEIDRFESSKLQPVIPGGPLDGPAPPAAEKVVAGPQGSIFDPDPAETRDAIGMKPSDLKVGDHVSQVMESIDQGKVNSKQAAQRLREQAAMAAMDGVDPKKRFANDEDWFNHQIKQAAVLAKDSMLAQVHTQLQINAPSNVLMSIYGPYRQTLENLSLSNDGNPLNFTAYGTQQTRDNALAAFQSSWGAYRDALSLTWANAKLLFMDAAWNGKAVYGANKDVSTIFGKAGQSVDMNLVEAARMRLINNLEIPMDSNPNIAGNIALHVLKTQSAWRLFLYDRGVPLPLTKPGIRGLAGVDNVAGYFNHAFKLRNDLYMDARMSGEFSNEADIQRWVDDRFNREFMTVSPREIDIKKRRLEDQIPSSVSDDEIGTLIANERIAQRDANGLSNELTYGVPAQGSARTDRAIDFSEEMRFQNSGEGIAPEIARAIGKPWWGDLQFPYRQAPLLGTALDIGLVANALPPIHTIGRWKSMDKLARAKTMATWGVASSVLGSFALLDAMDGGNEDLVIGNGPTDSKARAAWMSKLRAQGKAPNTVFGLPVAGLPIFNTLMLYRDLKENMISGSYSRYDGAQWYTGIMQVLTGQIMRTTGIAQIKQVFDLLNGRTSSGMNLRNPIEGALNYAGYMGGSYAIPGIGEIREISKWLGYGPGATNRDREPGNAEVMAGLDWDFLKRTEENLKSIAYSTVPITQAMFGDHRKELDHFGNKIRLPFGSNFNWNERFYPQIWPEGYKKTYAVLDHMGALVPPQPLLTRSLDGVSMSDKLQEEYRSHLATAKGDENVMADWAITSALPVVKFSSKLPIELPRGHRLMKNIALGEYPLAIMAEKHIKGNNRLQALNSLVQDPAFIRLMKDPITTADRQIKDMPVATLNKMLPKMLVNVINGYYEGRAYRALNQSQSPDAVEWRQRRSVLEQGQGTEEQVQRIQPTIQGIHGEPQ